MPHFTGHFGYQLIVRVSFVFPIKLKGFMRRLSALFSFPTGRTEYCLYSKHSIMVDLLLEITGNDYSLHKYRMKTEKFLIFFLFLHSDHRMKLRIQRYSLHPDFYIFLFHSEGPLDMTKWGLLVYSSISRRLFGYMFKCTCTQWKVRAEKSHGLLRNGRCSLSYVTVFPEDLLHCF
jgi:hypothetical protein